MPTVVLSAGLDDFRCRDMRLLEEASHLGELHVLLWSDDAVRRLTGAAPRFPAEERLYFAQAVRYVHQATVVQAAATPDVLPTVAGLRPDIWAIDGRHDTPAKHAYCAAQGLICRVLGEDALCGCPAQTPAEPAAGRKKVLVTGCYDWLHSGHVRFFEEVSEYGDVYAVVGHDANIALLKGAGHPQFPQEVRRYLVGSIRHVHQALISTGQGWLDAQPEIERLRPDVYAVNEDGDKPEKEAYCRAHGIEYLVLKRLPKPGLPRRQSTALRGF